MPSARFLKYGGELYYRVLNYRGERVSSKSETDDPDEAYSLAYETPDAVVEKIHGSSVEDTAYFSPKHPLPSRERFLKWARTRGRRASSRVRQHGHA